MHKPLIRLDSHAGLSCELIAWLSSWREPFLEKLGRICCAAALGFADTCLSPSPGRGLCRERHARIPALEPGGQRCLGKEQ